MDGPTSQSLPNEILSQVVNISATSSLRNSYNLSLTSHAFQIWTQPVLYDRLDFRTARGAQLFLRAILSKPPLFFSRKVHVKAVTFAETTPHPAVKAILTQCSKRLISFASRSTDDVNPGQGLQFIKSPYLRRLCLIWVPEGTTLRYPFESRRGLPALAGSNSPYHFVSVDHMSSVSHFISYTPHVLGRGGWQVWGNLSSALKADPNSPALSAANEVTKCWNSFQRLTHVALASQNYDFIHELLQVAQNIRYLVILHHRAVDPDLDVFYTLVHRFEECLTATNRVVEGKAEWRRRFIMLDMSKMKEVDLVNSEGQGLFWARVEQLIDEGYYSESGGWEDLHFRSPWWVSPFPA